MTTKANKFTVQETAKFFKIHKITLDTHTKKNQAHIFEKNDRSDITLVKFFNMHIRLGHAAVVDFLLNSTA